MDFELSGQVISGVGNEVMAFGVAVMLFVIPVFISIYRNIYRFNGDFDDLPLPDIGNETEHMIPSVVFNRDICPICLSTPELAVETCCGHYYCGLCLRECSNFATSTLIKCPLCRKPVTLLFVCFTMLELERQEQEAEKDRVYAFVSTYNRNCSHIRRTFRQVLLDWPTTMRHLYNELSAVGIVTFLARAKLIFCIAAAVLYVLSPLDFIPEAIFGLIGYADDLIVIALLGLYMSVVYRQLVIVRSTADAEARS